MTPLILESSLTFAACAALAAYVATRGQRSATHWLLLLLQFSMMGWTGGNILARVAGGPVSEAGIFLTFLGVFTVCPVWVLLASTMTRVGPFERWPGLRMAIWVPSALALLALLTNPAHRLFVRDMSVAAIDLGPQHYGQPLFWLFAIWGYSLILAGTLMYVWWSARLMTRHERGRGVLMAVAAIVPLVASIAHILDPAPEYDRTPLMLGLSALLFFVVDWRYQLLDAAPIARRDVIEHLHDGVIVTDANGVLIDMNRVAERLLRTPFAEVRGTRLAALLADTVGQLVDQTEEQIHAAVLKIAAGNPVTHSYESGNGRWLEVNGTPVFSVQGQAVGVCFVMRDRTEQRRFEALLRQSQRLETVAGLAAGIAHEVNNPLAFIRANLSHVQRMIGAVGEELNERGEKPEEFDEMRLVLEESIDGCDRIGRVIERVRRFSHIRDDELSLVQVNEVVHDATRLAALRRKHGIEVALDLAEHLPEIEGSAEGLVQAVLNLLANAGQALGEGGGHVSVCTRRHGEGVEICVADDGPGVPASVRERVFDPFFTTKPTGEGTGLGLAVSFGIVREHGGTLDLDSPPGGGARFTLRLPAPLRDAD